MNRKNTIYQNEQIIDGDSSSAQEENQTQESFNTQISNFIKSSNYLKLNEYLGTEDDYLNLSEENIHGLVTYGFEVI